MIVNRNILCGKCINAIAIFISIGGKKVFTLLPVLCFYSFSHYIVGIPDTYINYIETEPPPYTIKTSLLDLEFLDCIYIYCGIINCCDSSFFNGKQKANATF